MSSERGGRDSMGRGRGGDRGGFSGDRGGGRGHGRGQDPVYRGGRGGTSGEQSGQGYMGRGHGRGQDYGSRGNRGGSFGASRGGGYRGRGTQGDPYSTGAPSGTNAGAHRGGGRGTQGGPNFTGDPGGGTAGAPWGGGFRGRGVQGHPSSPGGSQRGSTANCWQTNRGHGMQRDPSVTSSRNEPTSESRETVSEGPGSIKDIPLASKPMATVSDVCKEKPVDRTAEKDPPSELSTVVTQAADNPSRTGKRKKKNKSKGSTDAPATESASRAPSVTPSTTDDPVVTPVKARTPPTLPSPDASSLASSTTNESPGSSSPRKSSSPSSASSSASQPHKLTANQKKGRAPDTRQSTVGTVSIPARPDRGGTKGIEVPLTVNCWDLIIHPKIIIMYQLDLVSAHRIDLQGQRKELRLSPKAERVLLEQLVAAQMPKAVFDGGHAVFSECPLPDVENAVTKDTELNDPLEPGKLCLKYRIQEVQKVGTSDLYEYVKNIKATSIDMPQICIRALDCAFKAAFKESLESLGRFALFERNPTKRIEQKLFSIHRGFLTTVRPQWQVRVNVDMTFKAFLIAGNLADVLYDKYGDSMERCVPQMEADIRRIRVISSQKYKEKTGHVRKFTVHGLSSLSARRLMIPNLNQSVADYFKTKHGIELQYDSLPCVKVNADRDVFFPMELLEIQPFQAPTTSKTDVAAEVIRLAAVQPRDRFREIQRFLATALRSGQPLLNRFGVKVKDQPVSVTGRVIDTPTGNFGRQPTKLTRGSWRINSFYSSGGNGGEIRWVVFAVSMNRNCSDNRNKLVNELTREARNFNLNLKLTLSADILPQDLPRRLGQLSAEKQTDLVVLILNDDFNYPPIKRLSDLQLGIRTQCIRDKTLFKRNVMPNLLLKINGKLGGVNWRIMELLHETERFMVLGADVTHPSPSPTHDIRMSVAAVTGSITPDLMRYAAVVRQQATNRPGDKSTREIIDALGPIMEELIKCYARNVGDQLPTKLFFYRDGVSEGQFVSVLREELAAIQQACLNIRQDYQPLITYIVVQKRHRIKMKPEDPKHQSRSGNAEPGTVVDTDITHAREFDFYMLSAEGIQGTSKPAHYYVLCDDSKWSSDWLQAFTFYLCHAYMRCTRSVSYPAPTYYAHLAAYRAREWLSSVRDSKELLDMQQFRIHESQKTGMFFL